MVAFWKAGRVGAVEEADHGDGLDTRKDSGQMLATFDAVVALHINQLAVIAVEIVTMELASLTSLPEILGKDDVVDCMGR